MAMSKKEKVNEARKNAEAMKAKKKAARGSKSTIGTTTNGKGKSIIGKSKAKK